MEERIKAVIAKIATLDEHIELVVPDERYGDYASNAAIKMANLKKENPLPLAQKIAAGLKDALSDEIESVQIAGPGFINIRLSDTGLIELVQASSARPYEGKVIVTEFSDPNPFKVLHAGHLYTSVIGDGIARLLESAGAKVYRINYGSDVGLHAAKSLWGMIKSLDGELPEKLALVPESERSEWMGRAYVSGNSAYEAGEPACTEINGLNRQIYKILADKDYSSPLAEIYWTTREWSYDQFKAFYAKIGITIDRYYPESETTQIGMDVVNTQLERGVFEKSDGAVVFRGENYGLHTRVFITRAGLPTYEAKEIGLAILKKRDYSFDQSVIITGNEQSTYMAVVLKALDQFDPELSRDTVHLTHGLVRLSGGVKMSSRKGNIVGAEEVLEIVTQAAAEEKINDQRVVLAAIKYSFLKQGVGSDIIFDPKNSVSILGNSGPYLQYAHARACSILKKGGAVGELSGGFTPDERSLLLRLTRFNTVHKNATVELSPHLLCGYLYELTQTFNHFYEANRVIGSEREALRLKLVSIYADRLRKGLEVLGIAAPEHL